MKTGKYSGKTWAEKFNIIITNPRGWSSVNTYNNVLITWPEFCNRASNSDIQTRIAASRRDAAETLKSKEI